MVKSVVKPLKMESLRERIVPKKSMFTRVFGVFCFGIPWGRCLAPKPPALSTAPRPDVLNYTTNALILQVVKSVVKTFCWCFFEKGNTRKSQCFQGFSAFLKTHGGKLPARSQTSRATGYGCQGRNVCPRPKKDTLL